MSRLEAVALRKDEISKCLSRHDCALRCLWQTTIAILEINHAKSHNDNLSSFLEANDLSNGRFFDSSTLPSVDSLKHVHATQADLNQKSDGSQIALETALEIQPKPLANHEKNVKSQGAAYSRTNEPSSWAKEESTDAAPSPRSPRGSAGQDNSIKSNGDGDAMDGYKIRPSEASPFSSDDAGSLASSTVRNIVAEQRARNPATVHLPSRDAQEEHLRRYDQERVHDDEPEGGYPDQFGQNVNGLTPPTSGEDVEPSSRIDGWKTKDNDSQHNIILKSQINMARTEAFGGTPATPDEQPRLEEAQSMQASKAPASVQEEQADGQQASQSTPATSNLSSQFLNDNMSEDDAMPDISDLTKHIVSKQDGVTRGGISEQDVILPKPLSGLRDHLFTGMSGESSRDLTLSRRPPMRIDTSVPSISETSGPTTGARPATTSTINSHFQSESSTPNKAAAAAVQSPPERMTTRVSSGALRHKSVSEILGETPKATPIQADRGAFDRGLGESNKADYASLQTPKSASSLTSPDPAIFKQRLNELRDKERSKLSTVVFASSRNSDSAQAQHPDENETPIKDRDYLLTLFAAQATNPLGNLLKTAHKTLNTSDHYTDFHERQACRVLSKIYELQASNRWSLRQIERSIEPKRPVTHWDVLLGQMKWMRTDFREERKWKHAAAKYIADACAEWVASSAEARKVLQVNVRSLPVRSDSMSLSAQTPDLVHSAEDGATEATDDDTPMDSVLENAPAAIFSLPPEMFIFGLNKSPVTEKLLSELPLYQPNTAVQDAALHSTEIEPDAAWKTPIVPVSKYVQGKIVAREGPPRKRRRLDYEDSAGSRFHSRRDTDVRSERLQNPVGPEQYDVALFDPENKHIRDRIHAAHTFRPPSEYSMPQQHFFECRQSSQWTQAEDDELRKDVRDYTYNWALIEDCLTSPSLFSSGAERRTQWECFERWISLEGLPVEMAKTQYFRAYHSRLQAAQNTVQAQQQALQQQHGNNGAQLPPRRRTTQPYTVERRKNARHLHLIDAMRKLAKKRETTLNKQQHVASLAAMRKANEVAKPKPQMHTPQEFSRIKHERQLQMEEKAKQYRAAMMTQQKVVQAQKSSHQPGHPNNGAQPARNPLPVSGLPNGSIPNMAATNSQGQIRGGGGDPSRTIPQLPRLVNGQANAFLPTNSHGVPHAPMQPNMQVQMQQRMPPNMTSDHVIQQVNRVQAEQAYIQQQLQQRRPQSNGSASSPHMQNPNLLSPNNPALLASMQGRSSPSINGVPPPVGSSSSPRMTQPQALSSGMTPAVNQISSQFKARHPQASPEQITRMTTDQLYKMSNEARQQAAMQAAAGNSNSIAVANNANLGLQVPNTMQQQQQAAIMANGGGAMFNVGNSQQYAQLMRQQQQSQQRGGSAGGQGMNGSRSSTPMNGNPQGGARPSQSPSARPVGLAGGQ